MVLLSSMIVIAAPETIAPAITGVTLTSTTVVTPLAEATNLPLVVPIVTLKIEFCGRTDSASATVTVAVPTSSVQAAAQTIFPETAAADALLNVNFDVPARVVPAAVCVWILEVRD